MKYIIVKEHDGLESSIVFPEHLSHCDIAKVQIMTGFEVVSAGFCNVGHTISSWGRSESLNINSRDSDRAILARDFSWD